MMFLSLQASAQRKQEIQAQRPEFFALSEKGSRTNGIDPTASLRVPSARQTGPSLANNPGNAVASARFPDTYSQNITSLQTIPDNLYVKNLAFFCRQELKFEKVARIPLRLRMGSLEQCNKLEGK